MAQPPRRGRRRHPGRGAAWLRSPGRFWLAPATAAICVGGAAGVEEVSSVNAGISVMLLGSIGFMMALFELTHCYRKAMAKYSWKAISATISIFSAVLIFQGVNGIVEAYILDGKSEETKLVVSFIHMGFWFLGLQALLAITTGVLPVKGFDPRFDDLEIMEVRLKTFAILLGHITGFAAINAFATLQQLVPREPLTTFLVAPFAWASIYAVGRVTDAVRERVALIGDNLKEKHEEMWDEETEETEDDVIGLAASFVFVQSARMVISGTLPNDEGNEPESVVCGHTFFEAAELIMLGFFLVFCEAIRILYIKKTFQRLTPQLKNIIAMTFAWCVFFGIDWFLAATIFAREQGMMKQVTLAMCVTIVALAMIFGLELVQDFKHLDHTLESAIRAIVSAIGILIGVAWEKAFDVAVAEVTETVSFVPAQWTKMLLSICLAGTVVPAWYRHIMPNIMMFEAEEEQEMEETEGRRESGLEEGEESLKKPLLHEGHEEHENHADGHADEAAHLRRLLEEHRQKVEVLEKEAARADELERKNQELEESIAALGLEIGDLQKLADKLVH